jgi:hypothetical protein
MHFEVFSISWLSSRSERHHFRREKGDTDKEVKLGSEEGNHKN